MIMRNLVRHLAVLIGRATAMAAVAADIAFYERDDMRERSFTANSPIDNFEGIGFNDTLAPRRHPDLGNAR